LLKKQLRKSLGRKPTKEEVDAALPTAGAGSASDKQPRGGGPVQAPVKALPVPGSLFQSKAGQDNDGSLRKRKRGGDDGKEDGGRRR
jgi:hypothetical protein